MEYFISIIINGNKVQVKAKKGANLLEILHSHSFDMASPCGGNGTCGKCKVKLKGAVAKPSGQELDLLGINAVKEGYRLACRVLADSDIEVELDGREAEASILTAGKSRTVSLSPLVRKKNVKLDIPSLENQASDFERILSSLGDTVELNCIELVRKLPGTLRKSQFDITAVMYNNKMTAIENGNTQDTLYGIAVDIGTTTLVAYLYDICTGERVKVQSMLNPQKTFGADVLSRIDYTNGSDEARKEMNKTIINALNDIIHELTSENSIIPDNIYEMVFVGNTTMMHFLTDLPARYMAVSPFIPVVTALQIIDAGKLNLNINKGAIAAVYPCVSAYIGADTVAAVLSSGMYLDDRNCLLIDIGTNGEIVLGNNEKLYACSTAAGPAFEGANIKYGMGGIHGAIDTVSYDQGLEYTTIGGKKAEGICGSGLVDAVSVMLEQGVIDETGRIPDEDETAQADLPLAGRIIEEEGKGVFVIDKNKGIGITQKDIRELQNAKAAIAAGIRTLIKRSGIKMDDISRVYLAGGFGSHINVKSAVKIGLIPAQLEEKVESIGNAAGEGAIEGLLCAGMIDQAVDIAKKIKYIELSGSPDFVDEYVNCMLF